MKENQEIKAVVSDMSMPHMSGVDFISKANDLFPEVIYFILTGYEISEEIKAAVESGLITKYFRKPFLMKIFDTEIQLALEQKS
jgi:response regulator RpfG family c-di-GMP phosphodiesterase